MEVYMNESTRIRVRVTELSNIIKELYDARLEDPSVHHKIEELTIEDYILEREELMQRLNEIERQDKYTRKF